MTKDSRDVIFFYVEGSDLDDVADTLRARFQAFVESRNWIGDVWFVDQIDSEDSSLKPGDLPDWDMGLNLAFDESPKRRAKGWFDDVAETIRFLRSVSVETGRDFVIGASFAGASFSEDLFFVGAEHDLDLEVVRVGLGG